jgi:Rrf2 family nitric oxide-sensitive transcriptional repressor
LFPHQKSGSIMQLTRFTDFGLRMLMYLSKHDRSTPITIAEIAGQFDVPHNHLIKVANRLGKLGLVKALRGRNGGLVLAVAPESIRLGDTLRGLEGDTPLVNCEEPPCALGGRCQLTGALRDGLDAFYARMNEFTLADVSSGRTETAIVTMHRNFLSSVSAAH